MNQGIKVIPIREKSLTQNPAIVKQGLLLHPLVILAWELLLALPLGLVFIKLHIGGIAWIFGGIGAGVLVLQMYRILYDYIPQPNRKARRVGMALVGLTVGAASAEGHLSSIVTAVPIFGFLTFFILLCGTLIGYIYSRLSKTNLLTALLATVPGGVGVMAAIAADYGRNVTLVALVQAFRVTTVVLLIPFIARTSVGSSGSSFILPVTGTWLNWEPIHLVLLAIILLITALVAYVAGLFKVPAGDFFSALIIGIVVNPILDSLWFVGDLHFSPPLLINVIGQMLLGITIGEYWGDKPTFSKQTIGYALMCVAMTLVSGAIAAMLAMKLTTWDWLTCLLVTAPGGSAEMILVSLMLNHNVEIVTAGHLVRLIAINSSIPLWVYLFRRIDSQFSESV
jgi:membrane AbrB-like protein